MSDTPRTDLAELTDGEYRGHLVWSSFARQLERELNEARTALRDANDLCRSAYRVAMREGRKTNWQAFRNCLSESLERQHHVMYPPKAQGWKCDLGNGQWDHDWQEKHDSAGEVDGGPGNHWSWLECQVCGAIKGDGWVGVSAELAEAKAAYVNMRDFAESKGLNTATVNPPNVPMSHTRTTKTL